MVHAANIQRSTPLTPPGCEGDDRIVPTWRLLCSAALWSATSLLVACQIGPDEPKEPVVSPWIRSSSHPVAARIFSYQTSAEKVRDPLQIIAWNKPCIRLDILVDGAADGALRTNDLGCSWLTRPCLTRACLTAATTALVNSAALRWSADGNIAAVRVDGQWRGFLMNPPQALPPFSDVFSLGEHESPQLERAFACQGYGDPKNCDQLENAVASHASVAQALAMPVRHLRVTQQSHVLIFARLKPGATTSHAALAEHAAKQLHSDEPIWVLTRDFSPQPTLVERYAMMKDAYVHLAAALQK